MYVSRSHHLRQGDEMKAEYKCANVSGYGVDLLRVMHFPSGSQEYAYVTVQHDCDRLREHANVTIALGKKQVENLIDDLTKIHAEMV